MRTLLVSTVLVFASAASFVAAAARPVVVELFTSEGCSSCPPADALLTSLGGRRDLLPLAFHVTYWNALGWRDPYSLEAATNRQAEYAVRLGGGSYTPEMAVDGRRGMVGSDREALVGAVAAARTDAARAATINLTRSGNMISISIGREIRRGTDQGAGRGEVLLVGYDPRHETRVGRGENRGRTLLETNIVRSIRRVADYVGDPIELAVPVGPGSELAVLIQAPDGGILGAARL